MNCESEVCRGFYIFLEGENDSIGVFETSFIYYVVVNQIFPHWNQQNIEDEVFVFCFLIKVCNQLIIFSIA